MTSASLSGLATRCRPPWREVEAQTNPDDHDCGSATIAGANSDRPGRPKTLPDRTWSCLRRSMCIDAKDGCLTAPTGERRPALRSMVERHDTSRRRSDANGRFRQRASLVGGRATAQSARLVAPLVLQRVPRRRSERGPRAVVTGCVPDTRWSTNVWHPNKLAFAQRKTEPIARDGVGASSSQDRRVQ